LGCIALGENIRNGAYRALEELRERGIGKIVMLTGASRAAAVKAAGELGLTDVRAQCVGDEKLEHLQELLKESRKKNKRVVFAGVAESDSECMEAADVGLDFGACDLVGSSAGIVVINNDFKSIARAFAIAKSVDARVKENVFTALLIKLLICALAAMGMATLWLAVILEMGTSVLTIINATRYYRRERTARED